jgi:hypothetical protein
MTTGVKLTRKEAKEFAYRQVTGYTDFPGKNCWHYGKCDIQELLDQIYGVDSKGEEVEIIPLA